MNDGPLVVVGETLLDRDLTGRADRLSPAAAVRAVADRAGVLDAVFAAAGTDRCGMLADVPGEEWDRVVLGCGVRELLVARAQESSWP